MAKSVEPAADIPQTAHACLEGIVHDLVVPANIVLLPGHKAAPCRIQRVEVSGGEYAIALPLDEGRDLLRLDCHRCRLGRKCSGTMPCTSRNRCPCSGDLNRFILRSRS